MSLDWHGAVEAVIHHPLFGIGITLGAYQLVLAAFEKTRWMFLQPVLVSMLLVIGVLLGCGLSYAEYRKSTEILSILLGPATVALAVPLYLNLRRIRQLFWPILTTLVVGGVLATSLEMLHYSPEPKVIRKVIEAAQLVGDEETAKQHRKWLKEAFGLDADRSNQAN